MRPLIVPMETVRLQIISSNTNISPASANGMRRARYVFVHSKHWEVPIVRLRFELHLPHRIPERP